MLVAKSSPKGIYISVPIVLSSMLFVPAHYNLTYETLLEPRQFQPLTFLHRWDLLCGSGSEMYCMLAN